jgi:hypothetical protein
VLGGSAQIERELKIWTDHAAMHVVVSVVRGRRGVDQADLTGDRVDTTGDSSLDPTDVPVEQRLLIGAEPAVDDVEPPLRHRAGDVPHDDHLAERVEDHAVRDTLEQNSGLIGRERRRCQVVREELLQGGAHVEDHLQSALDEPLIVGDIGLQARDRALVDSDRSLVGRNLPQEVLALGLRLEAGDLDQLRRVATLTVRDGDTPGVQVHTRLDIGAADNPRPDLTGLLVNDGNGVNVGRVAEQASEQVLEHENSHWGTSNFAWGEARLARSNLEHINLASPNTTNMQGATAF